MSRLRSTIYRANQSLTLAYETALAEAKLDLTAQQAAVIEAISNLDGPSQTNLVSLTGIDRSTMADIVRRLVRKGYVDRKKSRADARRYILKLTDKGKRVEFEASAIAVHVEARIEEEVPSLRGLDRRIQSLVATLNATHGSDVSLVAAE